MSNPTDNSLHNHSSIGKKYYVIAGEASGDLHGSYLIREMKKLDPTTQFRVWGGDLMQAEGAEVVKHYKDLAFMGFLEVLLNLRTILSNMKFCKKDILDFKPDAVIMIDYPGFNLPIAKFTHSKGIKTLYYIAPQVWAWKKRRVKTMRKVLDRLYVILTFEKDFFAKNNMDVDFVGHPLLDEIEDFKKLHQQDNFRQVNNLSEKPIIAVLPGSRKQEISKMLPIMLSVSNKHPQYQFVVAGMNVHGSEFYQPFTHGKDAKIIYNQTHLLLQNAHAAMVTSGTATLETALFNVPEVVCYKGSFISYFIAKNIIKIKYISLVNLIMDKPAVLELIQGDLNEERLSAEFEQIANNEVYRENILIDFAHLRNLLGQSGASAKTAKLITEQTNK